ncbi:MAG: accessory Sec system translocase SecA2 [Mobilibacterium timonense]|uniref:accessory Sec system translocase SecA2 n=1 Tax=Mobilibacterium timonense TaxID=1871012 RepID=UPI00235592FF|nr:accessory Sec system translocase SecA2 [Mobilibacterium timonense]MBM6990166.1 accessory Sec system translocase SecA2 [Mobilibacterium timonense]
MKDRRVYKILEKVKSLEGTMRSMTDEELQGMTVKLRSQLKEGKTTDQILPEAYGAICEADRRILGVMPYDVQILGAIALHKGYLAEMFTGEGKTLMATMPLYLNALTGKSTILVTANEYLASRDADELRPVFSFMGLTERAGVPRDPGEPLTNGQKKENYAADILYTTHSILAFDYLLNNLVSKAEDRFLREFYFVIIDEADSVLLDGAQMPLVISGSPRVQSNLYAMTDFFVTTLKEGRDYEKEDKSVWLTDRGVEYAERFFGIPDFYAHEYFEINRHVTLALRAHVLFEKQSDYMLSDDGEIVLLDNSTGRSLPGMKLRGGAHQALEEKEHVKLSQEQRSVASVTYQNLFLMFPKMCGMSGTISDAKRELFDVYHKLVFVVPPRKKVRRVDRRDRFFSSAQEQYEAALQETLARHRTGQPVLVVTATIQDTQIFSRMLVDHKVPHSVLNANNAYWEAEIIAEAGQMNAVTVSTGMAGRGTDIRLQDGVQELGGLAVIGIGRMENLRLERQARGRAGRQGDPGSSQFFVSLEDEVVLAMTGEKTEPYIDGERHISRRKLRRLINGAQKTMVEQSVSSREQSVRYDKILRRQREILYGARDRLLDRDTIQKDVVRKLIRDDLMIFMDENPKLTHGELTRFALDNLTYELDPQQLPEPGNTRADRKRALERLESYADELYNRKTAIFSDEDQLQEYLRQCILNALDDCWIDEVDYLQQLQYAITTRGTAQRNPIFEYSREAYQSFGDMKKTMKKKIVRNFFLGDPQVGKDGRMNIVFP